MRNTDAEPQTPVIFKLDKGTQSPVAFFPTLPGTCDAYTMTTYAHLGQHSSAHIDYVRECKPATPEQFAPLLRELQWIGYNLVIRRRATARNLATRREAISK